MEPNDIEKPGQPERKQELPATITVPSFSSEQESAAAVREPHMRRQRIFWKWLGRTLFTLLVVPSLLGTLAFIGNYLLTVHAGRQKSVELAVSILREPLASEEKVGATFPLRSWAVDVVNKLSEVPFSEDAARLLRGGYKTLPSLNASEYYLPIDGSCEVDPQIVRVGEPVTFSAFGQGGTHYYAYSWSGDGGVSSGSSRFTAQYRTSGCRSATVRITSNGQSVYRTCTVSVVSADSSGPSPPADDAEMISGARR